LASSKAWTKSWKTPHTTSVRLVTNPEKMVLRETERAFVYFSLHGLTVDAVIVNRLLPT
jgi:arsenite-transporting ATPase